MGEIMKRLLASDENVDIAFTLFKENITLDNIGEKLLFIYDAWDDADNDNQLLDIDSHISHISEWFDNFYDSVISDCIKDAKDSYEFDEKYNELTIEEQEQLDKYVGDYIYDMKDELVTYLQENGENE